MESELFDKIYTTILKHSEQKDKISDFIEENLCTDSYVIFNYGDNLADLLIEVLEKEFNDIGEWIDYCLYEKPKTGISVWDENKNPVKLDTTREIYDFLMENKRKNEESKNR